MEQRKSVWQFLKSTVIQWLEDRPFQLASSLSYYTIFSLAPLLVIVIAIAGFAFGEAAAEQRIVGTIQGMIGEDSARAIQTIIENASRQPKTGIISAAMGFLALLLGAGGVVGQLQTSLNTIWGSRTEARQGIRGFLRQRFLSLAIVMGIGFLLLVALIISATITGLSRFIGRFVTVPYALDVLVSLLLITSLFMMIYKFLPDVRIRWRDVWIGGLNGNALHDWQAPYRPLSGAEWRELDVRRRGIADHDPTLGILFIAYLFSRRRIHAGLRDVVRVRRFPGRPCRAHRRDQEETNAGAGDAQCARAFFLGQRVSADLNGNL
jgi:membrane protein